MQLFDFIDASVASISVIAYVPVVFEEYKLFIIVQEILQGGPFSSLIIVDFRLQTNVRDDIPQFLAGRNSSSCIRIIQFEINNDNILLI